MCLLPFPPQVPDRRSKGVLWVESQFNGHPSSCARKRKVKEQMKPGKDWLLEKWMKANEF